MKEWVNVMQGWSAEQLQKVVDDAKETVVRQAAARVWIHAASTGMNASGMPIAGPDFDRICDQTVGRPKQAVELTGAEGDNLKIDVSHKFDYARYQSEFAGFAAEPSIRGVRNAAPEGNGN